MPDEVTIHWHQVILSTHTHDQWFASLVAPFRSEIFAGVAKALDGTWLVELSPKGRGLGQPIIAVRRYGSLAKAKAHVERWGRAHWRTLPSDRRAT